MANGEPAPEGALSPEPLDPTDIAPDSMDTPPRMQNANEEVVTPEGLPPNGMELDIADGGVDVPLDNMLNLS